MEVDDEGGELNGGASHAVPTHPLRLGRCSWEKIQSLNTSSPKWIGLVVCFGSWNVSAAASPEKHLEASLEYLLQSWQRDHADGTGYQLATGFCMVDSSEDHLDCFVGDNDSEISPSRNPCPPETLPALALVLGAAYGRQAPKMRFLTSLSATEIHELWSLNGSSQISNVHRQEVLGRLHQEISIQVKNLALDDEEMEEAQSSTNTASRHPVKRNAEHKSTPAMPVDPSSEKPQALRIFVAGDRMSVGKTSTCLGLLGSFLRMNYPASSLAYIKPATQDESMQLVTRFCESQGIECIPIGPIVYYRGFTRAFLAGETQSADEMLAQVSQQVDSLATGKRIVIIDGVGFPAVGSITETDNAAVAEACGYPHSLTGDRHPLGVVLVGGSGVGGAVDAFNLNAAYFDRRGIPVLGAIFNKLDMEGYYSLENCKQQVSKYFATNEEQRIKLRQPFGFLPLFRKFKEANDPLLVLDDYFKLFGEHVDIQALIKAAERVYREGRKGLSDVSTARPAKRLKAYSKSKYSQGIRSRGDIEKKAINAGAAPSA